MAGLNFFIPLLALAAAAGAWLADLPVWAIAVAFFGAGPLAVLAAALVHLGEEGLGLRQRFRGRRRRAQAGAPPCPDEAKESAIVGIGSRRDKVETRGRGKPD